MRERVAHRAVAAHRVARDPAAGPVRDGAVRGVDVADQVDGERRLDRPAGIGASVLGVDVVARPAAPGSVRHDRDRRRDLALGDQLVEGALHPEPGAHRVAAAVQEVEDGVPLAGAFVAGGQIDVVRDLLVQGRGAERDGCDGARSAVCSARGRGEHDHEQGGAGRQYRREPGPHRSLLGHGLGARAGSVKRFTENVYSEPTMS